MTTVPGQKIHEKIEDLARGRDGTNSQGVVSLRKRFSEEIANSWTKEWLAGFSAKAVALKFLSENRERYSSQLEKGEHRAVSTVLPLLYY